MHSFYKQFKRIARVALFGMVNKQSKEFIPKQHKLSNKCYENVTVVYKARPISVEKVIH